MSTLENEAASPPSEAIILVRFSLASELLGGEKLL